MKKEFIAATALLAAVATSAQVSGPNRPGPGKSPGTFQAPATPDIPPPLPADPVSPISPTQRAGTISPTPPAPGSVQATPPRPGLDTPQATAGATDPFRSTAPSINDSRDWERSVGTPPPPAGLGADRRRLTPPPSTTSGLTPPPSALDPQAPRIGSDLNTTGVNNPARIPERPFDRALSAKIRAQLSTTPATGQPMVRIAPETVRDLRITSQNGRVVLEGNVGSPAEKEMIEFRAKEINGVTAIENRLLVRNQAIGAPGAIESGRAQDLRARTNAPIPSPIGQSPQNSDDLTDEHSDVNPKITPDR